MGYTSKEKWEYDLIRIEKIKESSSVSRVMIVWESEFRTHPHATVQNIIQEIHNGS